MKLPNTALICVLILAGAAGGIWLLNRNRPEPVRAEPEVTARIVRSLVVETKDRPIDITTQGEVTPRNQIELVAQVAGEVIAVSKSLENGGFFAKDDVLIKIDPRDYELEVTRAQALVAQAELRVEQEMAEAAVARREWEEVGEGKASSLTLREPQVKQARAELRSAQASLAKAELALERTSIRARFAGRVRTKSVDVGQFVALGTALAQIYSIESAEVRLPIPDSALKYLEIPLAEPINGSIQSHTKVTLQARFAQTDQSWNGTIVRTEATLDPRSRMVHVVARVVDPYGRADARFRAPLAVGMFVRATIHGKTFRDVIEIPIDTLRDDDAVLVIDEELKLHRRPVDVLFRDQKHAVLEGGLKAGERVCMSPIGVFVEGMPVVLEERKPGAEEK